MTPIHTPHPSPAEAARCDQLVVRLADGWTLVLDRREGYVDVTMKSANGQWAVLIAGYGQRLRVATVDANDVEQFERVAGASNVLMTSSCTIALPDHNAARAVAGFLGVRIA